MIAAQASQKSWQDARQRGRYPWPSRQTDGFEALWPTVFLRRTLPGHELANQALAAFILELDDKNKD